MIIRIVLVLGIVLVVAPSPWIPAFGQDVDRGGYTIFSLSGAGSIVADKIEVDELNICYERYGFSECVPRTKWYLRDAGSGSSSFGPCTQRVFSTGPNHPELDHKVWVCTTKQDAWAKAQQLASVYGSNVRDMSFIKEVSEDGRSHDVQGQCEKYGKGYKIMPPSPSQIRMAEKSAGHHDLDVFVSCN